MDLEISTSRGCVVALAGRRIDPLGTSTRRFPISQVGRVSDEIRQKLSDRQAKILVSAAACGADIIALEVAGELGMRRRIVLPLDPMVFREKSVTDRPGDWGTRFDQIVVETRAHDDLIIESVEQTELTPDYFRTNIDILNEAIRLSVDAGLPVEVLVVWDGQVRGDDDVTAHFRDESLRRGLPVTEVLTSMIEPEQH